MRVVYAEPDQLLVIDRQGTESRCSVRCTDGLVYTWSGRMAEEAPGRFPRTREPGTGRIVLESVFRELGTPSEVVVDERRVDRGSDDAAVALDRLLAVRMRFGLHPALKRQ